MAYIQPTNSASGRSMNVWKLILEMRKSYSPIAIDLCIKLLSLGRFLSKLAECPTCLQT